MPKPEPTKPNPARQSPAASRPPFRSASTPAPSPIALKSGVPHGATESGWLPDLVYTGGKFEAGMAFFADAVGKITRFSREPADLAVARRLEGQAALPGIVNTHSHAFHRALRGRAEQRPGGAEDRVLERMTEEDVFDTARMVFLEMLLSGVTCVGEFHYLHHRPDGTPFSEPNQLGREIIRAAHDVGLRIALLNVAYARAEFRGEPGSAPVRFRTPSADGFLRDTEAFRAVVEKEFPADEAWLGVGAYSLATVPLEQVKAISTYARAQRMRLHAHLSTTPAENAASVAEYGRTPVALLAEHGVIDKRFTAIDALQLSDEEAGVLGQARAAVCVCPTAAHHVGLGAPPIEKLSAAGAGIAFGSDTHVQVDLLKDARLLEYHLRTTRQKRRGLADDAATALFHAATFTGARSLGATGGALEVGRPADFFTVNLYDPSIAGAEAASLLDAIVFSLERRAIRDVWIGGRQRIAGGRHANQGPMIGRFVDAQKRIWKE